MRIEETIITAFPLKYHGRHNIHIPDNCAAYLKKNILIKYREI